MNYSTPKSICDITELMGHPRNSAVMMATYVTRDARQLGSPCPPDDWPQIQVPATYLHDPEAVGVTFPLLPGHREYLNSLGLMKGLLIELDVESNRRTLIERLIRSGEVMNGHLDPLLGYDHGSIEHRLRKELETNGDLRQSLKERFPLSTFESGELREIRTQLSSRIGRNPDVSYMANSKVELRRAAERFGFSVPEGSITTSASSMMSAARSLLQNERKLWAKVGIGAGGDMVRPIRREEEILTVAEVLQRNIFNAMENNPGQDNRDFMPPFIIEVDVAHMEGVTEIIGNFNAQAIIGSDRVSPIGISRQRTDDQGAYCGNEFDEIDSIHEQIIIGTLRKVCDWLSSIGYQGIVGVDIILAIRNGKLVAFAIDCNARQNGSTNTILHRTIFNQPYALNMNMVAPGPISHFEQVRKLLGDLLFTEHSQRGVLPRSFKTVNAGSGVIVPSKGFKVDLLARSREEGSGILQEINERMRSLNPDSSRR